MFTGADTDNFIHVMRCSSDSYLIVSKDFPGSEEPQTSSFTVVKPDFNMSREYTDLLAAKELCETLFELLGVQTYNKHSKIGLSIEIIKEPSENANVNLI